MNNKIGIGIITYKRPEAFERCFNSIPCGIGEIVVVNDTPNGEGYTNPLNKICDYIQHDKNKGVAISKNDALRHLIQKDCTHLFLIEDDQEIINPVVFEEYIKYSEKTGNWHWNFSQHGPANKNPDGTKRARQVVDYGDGVEVGLFPNCVGAFSYYLKNVIKAVGYMDERFSSLKCWEHVEHTNRIIKAGLTTPFWWFADMYNSDQFIKEQFSSEVNSVITDDKTAWKKNIQIGGELYKNLHGVYPTQTPDTKPDELVEILKHLKVNYTR